MTLVVARTLGGKVWIVSDTLISGGTNTLRQPEYALKILALDSSTFIAYSGSPEIFHSILAKHHSKIVGQHIDLIAEVIFRAIGDASIEALISQEGRLSVVKNRSIIANAPTGWLGDVAAFSLFQENMAGMAEPNSPDGGLHTAMTVVVSSRKIATVGGPVVVASSGAGSATYSSLMHLVSPPYRLKTGVLGRQTVDFGDAARGGYAYTTLTPHRSGVCGWGIYYFQAERGIYFAADIVRNKYEKFVESANTVDMFCKALEREIGYQVNSCGQLGSSV